MTDRTIIITGASDGIGAAAARYLVAAGDTVVLVGRSLEKTSALAKKLDADFFVADFTRLADVRVLAGKLLERYPRIDILANNAGGIMGDREITADGHEKTFQVNHLAPFLLTTLMMERLVESQATVINTSSMANRFSTIDIDDLDLANKYTANAAYGNAKLSNILFTKELHRRYNHAGISTAAFHPGVVATNFSAGSTSAMRHIYQTVLSRFLLTPEQGADTLLWLANGVPGTDWESGEFYSKRKVSKANAQAYDADLAVQLWDRSEELVAALAR